MSEVFSPATQNELQRFVADNATGPKRTLSPCGGRTSLSSGWPGFPVETLLDLRQLNRVVDYPDRDMTITVEAGMRVDDLKSLLQTNRQRLPIDIPQSSRATIGGAIATNTSGPRRYGLGTFRDYLIGLTAVDAQGRLFHSGGRVVKNVAGYDLCKLLTGSRGSLAVMTQVTLKLWPVAESTACLWCPFRSVGEIEHVLTRLLTSAARPVALEVLAGGAAREVAAAARLTLPVDTPVLCLTVEGSPHVVDWQLDQICQEIAAYGPDELLRVVGDEADRLLTTLTEFPTSADVPAIFRANLLPSRAMEFAAAAAERGVAVQIHAGNGIILGQLAEEVARLSDVQQILAPLIEIARSGRGNLQVLHCDPQWRSELPMCGLPEPSWELMRSLKRQLDPDGLLNPGQFIDGATAKN